MSRSEVPKALRTRSPGTFLQGRAQAFQREPFLEEMAGLGLRCELFVPCCQIALQKALLILTVDMASRCR